MNRAVRDLLDQARRLAPDEQLEFVELLLHETAPDVEAAWIEEARRRLAAHHAELGSTYDAEQVIDDIRARLNRRRAR